MEEYGDTSFAAYNSEKPVAQWTIEEVVDYARKVLTFSEESAKILIKQEINGRRLLRVPSLEKLESYGMSGGDALDLWAEIEKMKKSLAEPGTNVGRTEFEQLVADVEELKLTRSSSAQVAQNAQKYLRIDDNEARRNISTGSPAGTTDLQIANTTHLKIKDDLQALIAKHFRNENSLLCLVDTHKTPIYGMNNMPDFVFVQQNRLTTEVVANAIIGVMEIKLDNQLTQARGQAVSDIMELRKAQPDRTEFYTFIANRSVCVLHKFVFGKPDQFVHIYQTSPLDWKQGSALVWQFMFTNATSIGFIPTSSIQIKENGILSTKHYHSLWSSSVCLFQISCIISGGMKRTAVAIGFVESPKHTTKAQQRDAKVEVIVKYSPKEATNCEIEKEINALDSLQKLLRKHSLDGEKLPLSIPILIASGVTPVEKYPFVITYPKGTPISSVSAVGDLVSFSKALNEALVHAHKNNIFHTDVSLKNIVMHGIQPILIDWGYAIRRDDQLVGFTGTLTFASINVSRHINDSSKYTYRERDDFESLFYVILFLANENSLPWSKEKTKEKVAKLKEEAMLRGFNKIILSGVIPFPLISFLQKLHSKLFGDLNANVKSLFDEVELVPVDKMK